MSADFDWEAHEALIAANGLTIDRPRFTAHPHFPEVVYPLDYGYINDTVGLDDQEIDVFVGTAPTGLVGALLTVDHRKGDHEFKLLYDCSPQEVYLVNGFINFAPALMSGELLMRHPMGALWRAAPPGGTLDHLDLNVRDLGRSGPFYEAFLAWLGYAPFQQWPEGRSWRKNGAYVVLVQTDPARLEAGFHRKRVGVNHLAFAAARPEEVDRFYREFLLPRDVPVLYGGPREDGGTYAVYFEDPDRLKLELVYRPRL